MLAKRIEQVLSVMTRKLLFLPVRHLDLYGEMVHDEDELDINDDFYAM